MPDASPTRWHLAHATWFFETFVLARWQSDYRPFSEDYQYLFNSYYNSVGEQFPRAHRGLLTRPTVAEVFAYRQAIDKRMCELLATQDDRGLGCGCGARDSARAAASRIDRDGPKVSVELQSAGTDISRGDRKTVHRVR